MGDWKLVDREYIHKDDIVKIAKEYQGGDQYCCIDKYELTKLKAGERLVKLNGTSSGYFTTLEALEKSNYNSLILNEGIQVAPGHNTKTKKYSYRIAVDIYELRGDIKVAQGITNANTHFGNGGEIQNYIPNFKELEDKGVLKKIEAERKLHSFEITREQYDLIQLKRAQQVLKRDLQCNLYEKSRWY